MNLVSDSGRAPVKSFGAFDSVDDNLRSEREAAFNRRKGPRAGDWVIMSDGSEERFSHHWGDGLQTSKGGNFYLGDGFVEFSGSLHPIVPKNQLADTGELREAPFWFFHRDVHRAHNSVHVGIAVRVFRVLEPRHHENLEEDPHV